MNIVNIQIKLESQKHDPSLGIGSRRFDWWWRCIAADLVHFGRGNGEEGASLAALGASQTQPHNAVVPRTMP